jgi:protoporphyrinogen oxidase
VIWIQKVGEYVSSMDGVNQIIIIGAGPAGLAAAHTLVSRGANVKILEASDSVGGLARSIDLWGQKVDLGPHRFFSANQKVNKLWDETLEDDFEIINRQTRIYYKNKFYHYPIQPMNALRNLGVLEALLCVFSFLIAKLKPLDQNHFEGWVSKRFGTKLYGIFFKSYSEKLWGIKCSELSSDFAKQRIRGLSLYKALKAMFFTGSKKAHKTLLEEFKYPSLGAGMFYEKLASRIISQGGEIVFNSPVLGITRTEGGNYKIQTPGSEEYEANYVINTMPLTNLVNCLEGIPEDIKKIAFALKFRTTILVYHKIESEALFDDQWLYLHDSNVMSGRITNFSNWSKDLKQGKKETILCFEYWCDRNDEIFSQNHDQIIDLAKKDLRTLGFGDSAKVKDGFVIKIPKCYPIYDLNYLPVVNNIKTTLEKYGKFQTIGRNGSFKYNNQDHSILMGICAAENILDNAKHSLWDINSDQDYQEDIKAREIDHDDNINKVT